MRFLFVMNLKHATILNLNIRWFLYLWKISFFLAGSILPNVLNVCILLNGPWRTLDKIKSFRNIYRIEKARDPALCIAMHDNREISSYLRLFSDGRFILAVNRGFIITTGRLYNAVSFTSYPFCTLEQFRRNINNERNDIVSDSRAS